MRSQTDALPVRLALRGGHRDAIRRWVETVAGWQAVEDDAVQLVPPRVVIADVRGADGTARAGLPVVLLVGDDADPAVAAAAGRHAAAVLRWPHDRDRVREHVGALTSTGRRAEVPTVTVVGAAGGVGTTTVALALGGLAAWRVGPALVVSHGTVPAPTTRTWDASALTGAGTWDAADPVPGVAGLRVVRLAAPTTRCEVDPGGARFVVRDVGPGVDADVLVARRDRAGLTALARSPAALVVLADVGTASPRAVHAAAGERRLVTVPWSPRVGRAGLRGQVPAAIPGSWLRRIAPALTDGAGRPRPRTPTPTDRGEQR